MQIRKRLSALLFAWVLCGFLAVTAYAVDVPDLSRTGSISLTMTYNGKAVAGGTLTLYHVGEIKENDGNYSFALTGEFSGCKESLENPESPELSSSLEEYALANDLTGMKLEITSDGTVVFSDLEPGLYLLVQTQAANGYETAAPFLVSVPIKENGTYIYDVNASPKVSLKTKAEPTTTEPAETEPAAMEPRTTKPTASVLTPTTLPNTGQLNWPIPILAVLGLCLFSIGWLLRCGKKEAESL